MNWAAAPGVFLTGTDTGVGKTYAGCLLLKELQAQGRRVLPFKPVACGDREDIENYHAACEGIIEPSEITPFYYQSPVAPLAASRFEGFQVDRSELLDHAAKLKSQCDFLLTEGAGGWEVPLAEDYGIPDLAADLELPIILVVANRLGALNHTRLTCGSILGRGLPLAGIILNHPVEERDLATVTNRTLLQELLNVPILGEILAGGDCIDWEPEFAP